MKGDGIVKYLAFLGIFFSCGIFTRKERIPSQKFEIPIYKKKYELTDKSGRFSVYREAGKSKKDRNYVVKKRIYFKGKKKKAIEQSIAMATPGRLKNINIVRPLIAQYMVWLDKKKYFSELKLDVKSKSMVLRLESPEKQWNGTQKILFPQGTGVFCFFSMVVECVAATGFIKKAIKKGFGKMRFHIIWDGYPYIKEQYRGLPDEIFSLAELVFEDKGENEEKKFSLSVGNQTIFYVVRPEGVLKKIFWISQGMSMVEINKGERL